MRRVLQITELVRECLQQRDANCTILPAPPETCGQGSTATILQRCACKDATSASPLRKILSSRRRAAGSGGGGAHGADNGGGSNNGSGHHGGSVGTSSTGSLEAVL